MNKARFETPILLITWCRPEKTLRVIEKIKEVNPKKIYIASDGYKKGDKKNKAKVEETREIIKNHINWKCEAKNLFSINNQGCKYGVSNAINWFFQNENEGIILEDDCLPHIDFFYFCEEILRKYRFDDRVWSVTGQNVQNGKWHGDASYYFSKYSHCWGWASWRRCWENYDRDIKSWPKYKKSNLLSNLFENNKEIKYWKRTFDNLYYQSTPDTWDYQWTYACMINSGLTVIPNQNLIENIGFDYEATHTQNMVFETKISNFNRFTSSIIPIKHPENIYQNKKADLNTELICYSGYPLLTINSIKKLMKKLKSIFMNLKFML